ncbi:hypothetical protein Tco_0765036 [Tanacetum coccineum]
MFRRILNSQLKINFTNQFLEEKPPRNKPEKPILNQSLVNGHCSYSSGTSLQAPPNGHSINDLTISHRQSSQQFHATSPTSTATTSSAQPRAGEHSLPPSTTINLNRARGRMQEERKVSKAVDEIVTNEVDWTMQAPLRARFSELPAVDMKEVLQQRISEETRRKKRKKHASSRTPSGSPPSQPPPLPPPVGASSALGSAQQQGSKAPSSSKTAALTPQSMAWTTSDNRYESTGVSAAHESSPTDF